MRLLGRTNRITTGSRLRESRRALGAWWRHPFRDLALRCSPRGPPARLRIAGKTVPGESYVVYVRNVPGPPRSAPPDRRPAIVVTRRRENLAIGCINKSRSRFGERPSAPDLVPINASSDAPAGPIHERIAPPGAVRKKRRTTGGPNSWSSFSRSPEPVPWQCGSILQFSRRSSLPSCAGRSQEAFRRRPAYPLEAA